MAGELAGGFTAFLRGKELSGQRDRSLTGRIAANFAAPQGSAAGVIAGLAGKIRMRYGVQEEREAP
jgi:hypothetical protein